MDFVDDELEVLHCFEPLACESYGVSTTDGVLTFDENQCDAHELNKAVEEDAKLGCW